MVNFFQTEERAVGCFCFPLICGDRDDRQKEITDSKDTH